MDFDLAQTDALLSTTRAVRKRLDMDREVPDDVLLECLQLAVQAPTGSNSGEGAGSNVTFLGREPFSRAGRDYDFRGLSDTRNR